MQQLLTKNNHNMYDIASLLQKSLRRGDLALAGYASNELFETYHSFLWRRLIVISAEDCFGVITKEIMALYDADQLFNKGKKGADRTNIFVSKAVVLLAYVTKNRDSAFFACNLFESNVAIPDDALNFLISDGTLPDGTIPDYTYDCHTLKGTMRGKKIEDMVVDEQTALKPHQLGLFDNSPWDYFYMRVADGEFGEKYAKKSRLYKSFKK